MLPVATDTLFVCLFILFYFIYLFIDFFGGGGGGGGGGEKARVKKETSYWLIAYGDHETDAKYRKHNRSITSVLQACLTSRLSCVDPPGQRDSERKDIPRHENKYLSFKVLISSLPQRSWDGLPPRRDLLRLLLKKPSQTTNQVHVKGVNFFKN